MTPSLLTPAMYILMCIGGFILYFGLRPYKDANNDRQEPHQH